MGKVVRDNGPKIFQIETTLNTDTFPSPFDFLSKREWEWTAQRPCDLPGDRQVARPRAAARLARKIFHDIEAPYQHDQRAGRRHRERAQDHARQRLRASNSSRSRARPTSSRWASRSSARTTPTSIMNPILVMCMGLGYLFNMYRSKPLVREGGVVIMTHPTYRDFHPVHHPSYIDFFEQVLADTERSRRDVEEVGEAVRRGRVVPPPVPHRQRLPRRAPVLRVVLGRPRTAARRQGDHRRRRAAERSAVSASRPASTMDDAFEIASDVVGRSATVTHLHVPAILVADVK